MLIKRPEPFKSSEITDSGTYLRRRDFLRQAIASGLIAAGPSLVAREAQAASKIAGVTRNPKYTVDEELSEYEDATTYNNFYEFGTGKRDPAKNAHTLKPRPWSVKVSGACGKPGTYDYDDLVKPHMLEERVYRFRCVEAWSMVLPWVGVSLSDVLKRFEPTSNAKYVAFRTLVDPAQMPGQKRPVLDWPYSEGLRMDEAMHPLTLFTVGMYGEVLPNQNGAPIRLVVPWKYGFKSIKSIVAIDFVEKMPPTTWNIQAPREYGFYSNVNPEVDHPRWSQARERRIGEGFFSRKRLTPMFNGYADDVGSLYAGMDLRKFF